MLRAALAGLGMGTKARPHLVPAPRLPQTDSCVEALRACLEPKIRKGHEGKRLEQLAKK
jgi:hypothetical protein